MAARWTATRYLGFSPRHRVGVIALANLGGGTANQLGEWLMTQVVESARQRSVLAVSEAQDALSRGDWADAARGYALLAEHKADKGQFHYRHGSALRQLRRDSEAITALEKALELGYARALTLLNLARLRSQRHEHDLALAHLRDALAAGLDAARLRTDRDLAELREHPGFEALLAEAGR